VNRSLHVRVRVTYLRPATSVLFCLLLGFGAIVSIGAKPASAACTLGGSPFLASWIGGDGPWNFGSGWSTGMVPNFPTPGVDDVCITSGTVATPVTVTLDNSNGFIGGGSANSLQLDANNTLIIVNTGAIGGAIGSLSVGGPQIINAGQIEITALVGETGRQTWKSLTPRCRAGAQSRLTTSRTKSGPFLPRSSGKI